MATNYTTQTSLSPASPLEAGSSLLLLFSAPDFYNLNLPGKEYRCPTPYVATADALSLDRSCLHQCGLRCKDGRAIIKGTTDTAVARSLYARYVGS